jgi:integrase
MFEYIMLERPVTVYDTGDEKKDEELKELEEAALFVIDLLWEGMPYSIIRKLDIRTLVVKNNYLTVLMKIGKTIMGYPLTKLAIVIIERSLRNLGSWTQSYKKAKEKTIRNFEDCYPKVQYLIQSILREAARKVGLRDTFVSMESFRQMGILHKYIAYNIPPAAIASFFGPESCKVSFGPQYFFEGYNPKRVSVKTSKNDKQKDFDFGRDDEMFDKCVDILKQIETDPNKYRKEAVNKLSVIEKDADNKVIPGYLKYLLSIKTNKYLQFGSVERYFYGMKSMYLFCKRYGLDKMNDEDVLRYLTADNGCEKGEKKLIEYREYKNIRPALNHFRDFTGQPRVKWQKFMKYCVHSCKLIILPDEEQIKQKIDEYLADENPIKRKAGIALVMMLYLGVRESECYNAETARVRYLGLSFDGVNEDYIEVKGKRGLWGKVLLSLIPQNYLNVFNDFVKTTKENNLERLFSESEVGKIEYQVNKIVSGEHVLRHGFATRNLLAGMNNIVLSGHMRHATSRVLHDTYDQSAYETIVKCYEKYALFPEKISLQNLISIYRISRQDASAIIKEIKHEKRPGVYTKGGCSNVYFSFEDIFNRSLIKIIKKIKRLPIKVREGLWADR